MSITSLILTIAIVLSFVYTLLALVAFRYVKPELKEKQHVHLLALTLWWPFYDIYDSSGQALCKYGKVLCLLDIVAYVAWGVMNYG